MSATATQTHNVCALISGGKDSFYSAYLCAKEGHTIVALANLSPPHNSIDDMDSHCFQTVGHRVVPTFQEATGIPLFRENIVGGNICSSLKYEDTKGDEVEDLFRLLRRVVAEPTLNVTAVCCGAIASTYQYNRVIRVAKRLGLDVLTPLWNLDDSLVIESMIRDKMEFVLIKVASAGLDESFLGSVVDYHFVKRLESLKNTFGMNLCGGEFESLVLFCPLLFKKRIAVTQGCVKFVDRNPFAPVVMYDIVQHKLVET